MKEIIKLLTSKIGSAILSLLTSIVKLFSKICDIVAFKQHTNKEKTIKKEVTNKEKEIENACKNGSISELLTLSLLVLTMLISGCASTNVTISLTKSWEGHYFSEKDAQQAVSSMKLEKKESVWILSDATLNQVLKQILKEGQKLQ